MSRHIKPAMQSIRASVQSNLEKRQRLLGKLKPRLRVQSSAYIANLSDGQQLDFWQWDLLNGHFNCYSSGKTISDIYSIVDFEDVLYSWVKDGAVYKDDRRVIFEAFESNINTAKPFRCYFRRLNGILPEWWQLEGRYEHDKAGKTISCVVVVIRAEDPIRYYFTQKERLYRNETIANNSQSVAWVWQVHSQKMHCEQRCWALIGFSDIPKTRDRSDIRWIKRIHAADRPRFSTQLKECLAQRKRQHQQAVTDTPSSTIRYRIRHKDKQWCWIETRIFVYRHKQELILVGYHRRIDQLIKTQLENERKHKHLKKSLSDKTRFLSEFAHELASPMQAIVGFSELCQKDKTLSEAQRQNLNDMQASAQTLLKTVKSVLFTVKLQQGALVWSRQPVLVKKLLKEWQAELLNFNVQCVIDTSAIEDKIFSSMGLWGDFLRTRQVLRGLSIYLSFFAKKQENLLLAIGVSRLSLPSKLTTPLVTLSLYHSSAPVLAVDEKQWHSPFCFLPEDFQKNLPFEGCNLHTLRTLVTTTGGHLDSMINNQEFLGYRCQWPLVEENIGEWSIQSIIDDDLPLLPPISVGSNSVGDLGDLTLSNQNEEGLEGRRWQELMGVTQIQSLPSVLWVNMRMLSADESATPTVLWDERGAPLGGLPEMVDTWRIADDPLSATYLMRSCPVNALMLQWDAWCHNSWIRPDEWLSVLATDQKLASIPLIVLLEDDTLSRAQLEQVLRGELRLVANYDGLCCYEFVLFSDSESDSGVLIEKYPVKLFFLYHPVRSGAWLRLVRDVLSVDSTLKDSPLIDNLVERGAEEAL